MRNKDKAKELSVDFIGGEALTAEEEAQLKEYFSRKKRERKPGNKRQGSKSKKDQNTA